MRAIVSAPRLAPVRGATAGRRAVAAKATAAKVAPVAVAAAAYAAIAPAADAAMQVATLAEGEPLIVTLGWCATCAMFSFSLALVVWGRSGL